MVMVRPTMFGGAPMGHLWEEHRREASNGREKATLENVFALDVDTLMARAVLRDSSVDVGVSRHDAAADVVSCSPSGSGGDVCCPLDVSVDVGLPKLHQAALRGDRKVLADLLAAGAEPDRTSQTGATALMMAARTPRVFNRYPILMLLLKHGARHDLRDARGMTCETYLLRSPVAARPRERTLLAGVRAAGTWKRFVHERRLALLVLRHLVVCGRATTAHPKHARLFGSAGVPAPVFWKVLEFWDAEY